MWFLCLTTLQRYSRYQLKKTSIFTNLYSILSPINIIQMLKDNIAYMLVKKAYKTK